MGIGIVLIAWAVIGSVLAGIGALVLGLASAFLTRGAHANRKGLIVLASFFPFICLGWGGAIFAFQAVTNEFVFHRDPGLGDTWTCPLPNGYALMMVDINDQGYVYNPRTQPDDSVIEQDDSIGGIVKLQIAGRYILAGADIRPLEQSFDDSAPHIDSFFLVDTQLGKHTKFSSYEELQTKAREVGLVVNLEPIATIYRRYRFTWFDAFAAALFFFPPLAGFILLIRWTFRIRKTRGEFSPV